MVECPRNQELPPGTWNLWKTGKRGILFSCPKCGDVGLLDHAIADDGEVTTLVQCPKLGCGFHDRIKLLDWGPQDFT
jgi:predicted RNA-binding Zn-ribbon protein involved in translation (DUF1610 family)